MQLIDRASKSSANEKDSFKRMSFELKEIRERVERLTSAKLVKPSTPSWVQVQRRDTDKEFKSDHDGLNVILGASNIPVSAKEHEDKAGSIELNGEKTAIASLVDVKEKDRFSRKSSIDDTQTKVLQKLRSSPLSALTLYY